MVLSITAYYDFINIDSFKKNENFNNILKLLKECFNNDNNENNENNDKINYYQDILKLKDDLKNKVVKPILIKYYSNNNHLLKRAIKENLGHFGQELNILFGLILKEFGLEKIILLKKCFINKNEISFHIGLIISINFKEYIIDFSKELVNDLFLTSLNEENQNSIEIFSNQLNITIEDIVNTITNKTLNEIKKQNYYNNNKYFFSNCDSVNNNLNLKIENNNFIKSPKSNIDCVDEFLLFFNQGITILNIQKFKLVYENKNSKIIYPSNNQHYNELLKYFILNSFLKINL